MGKLLSASMSGNSRVKSPPGRTAAGTTDDAGQSTRAGARTNRRNDGRKGESGGEEGKHGGAGQGKGVVGRFTLTLRKAGRSKIRLKLLQV